MSALRTGSVPFSAEVRKFGPLGLWDELRGSRSVLKIADLGRQWSRAWHADCRKAAVSIMLGRCPWLPFQPSSGAIFQEAHLCAPAECSSGEGGEGAGGRGLVLAIFSLFALKLYFCAGFSFNPCTYPLPKSTCSPSQGCLTESFSSFKQV